MKLVTVLRDPIERAYSHFQMELRWGRETGTFEDALAREEVELPRDLALIREDQTSEPPSGFARSYVGRGLYADQLERWLAYFDPPQLLVVMSDDLADAPAETMTRVAAFLGIPAPRAAQYPRRGVQEYAAMAPETRDRLTHLFAPHDRRLAELLGRELPWMPGTAVGGDALTRARSA
jgi:hypothetical protein